MSDGLPSWWRCDTYAEQGIATRSDPVYAPTKDFSGTRLKTSPRKYIVVNGERIDRDWEMFAPRSLLVFHRGRPPGKWWYKWNPEQSA